MSGFYNRRITIKQPVATATERGGWSTAWQTVVADLPAMIQPLSGREVARYQQQQSQITTKIVIRYRGDIDRTMRAYYGGREYHLASVRDPNERRQYLEIMAFEIEPGEGASV